MGSDSKTGSGDAKIPIHPVPSNSIASVVSKSSKGPEVSSQREGSTHNMATIADDDDRLLVRIGYTPVCISREKIARACFSQHSGTPTSFLEMVHSILRHFDSRCLGL